MLIFDCKICCNTFFIHSVAVCLLQRLFAAGGDAFYFLIFVLLIRNWLSVLHLVNEKLYYRYLVC